jgi:hypothetical protein
MLAVLEEGVPMSRRAAKPGKRWPWWLWSLLVLGFLISLGITVLEARAVVVDLAHQHWAAAVDPGRDAGGAVIGFAVLVFVLIKLGPRGVQEGFSWELYHYENLKKSLEQSRAGAATARARADAAEVTAAEAEQALAEDPANPNTARLAAAARARAAKLAQRAAKAEAQVVTCTEESAKARAALDEAYPEAPAG